MNTTAIREIGKKIKVIVCDLDHTLLNSQKQISAANLAAIKSAQACGIFVTICSGRIFTMLEAYEKELQIRGPLISTNGAAIINSGDHKILWSQPVDAHLAVEILDHAKSAGYDYSALTGSTCYFSPGSLRIQWFHQYNQIAMSRGMQVIPLQYFNGTNNIIKDAIYKILVYEKNAERFGQALDYFSHLPGIDCTTSEYGLLDILAASVNKGKGLVELKRILGVQKDQVCVFGDYLNDLPMFAEAVLPIAMGNAHESVKAKALLVTDTNDQDGIAAAIEQYIL